MIGCLKNDPPPSSGDRSIFNSPEKHREARLNWSITCLNFQARFFTDYFDRFTKEKTGECPGTAFHEDNWLSSPRPDAR